MDNLFFIRMNFTITLRLKSTQNQEQSDAEILKKSIIFFFFLNWNNVCPIKVAFSWKFWYAIGTRMAYILGYGIRNHKLSKRSVKISSYSERTIGFRNNKCKKRLKNNSSLALQLFRWLARSDYLKVQSCKLYIITNIWSLQHQITDTEIFALIAALLSYWAGKFCL